MKHLALSIALAVASLPAAAAGVIPEPDVLSLFGIGAAGGLILWMRNRKKK